MSNEFRVRVQSANQDEHYKHDAMVLVGTPLPVEGQYLEGLPFLSGPNYGKPNVGQVVRVDHELVMLGSTCYMIPRILVAGLRERQ